MFDRGVRVRESFLEEIEAPFADALAASATEAWVRSPLSSLARTGELIDAEVGGFQDSEQLTAEDARARLQREGLDRFLQVPDDGIREGALDLLVERKREELRRQDTMARGPGGFGAQAAYFGAGLGASLMDPINVAAAFIPFVGQARYARMIAAQSSAAGRAGVRLGVGAVEGAAGAALVEPIVLFAAQREQADYDLNNSLLNIAFGAVLGGGLHVGVGVVSDALARGGPPQPIAPTGPLPRILDEVDPGTREAALRSAIGQAVSGRRIEVEALLRADPRMGDLLSSTTLSRITAGGESLDDFLGRAAARPDAAAPAAVPQLRTLLPAATGRGEVRSFATREEAEATLARAERRNARGLEIIETPDGFVLGRAAPDGFDALRTPDGRVREYASERAARRAVDSVAAFRGAEVVPIGGGRYALVRGADPDILAAIRARPDAVRFADRPSRAAQARRSNPSPTPEPRRTDADAAPRAEPQADGGTIRLERGESIILSADGRRQRVPGVDRTRPTVDVSRASRAASQSVINDVRAQARRSFDPEGRAFYDAEANRASDRAFNERTRSDEGETAANETAVILSDLQALAANLGDDGVVARELAEFDALAQTADDYGNAVRAAAACQLRRGAA